MRVIRLQMILAAPMFWNRHQWKKEEISRFNNLTTNLTTNSGYLQTVNNIFPQKGHTKLPITQAPQRLLRTKSSIG